MKFSTGDKAVVKDHLEAHRSFGVFRVVGYLGAALLVEHYGSSFVGELHSETWVAEPGTRGWRESVMRYSEEELFTLEEAADELRRLEAIQSKLDQEFEEVRDLILSKMFQATEIVKEAFGIAQMYQRDFSSLSSECRPLGRALMDAGWRASTASC
jgi:hypothetical protein